MAENISEIIKKVSPYYKSGNPDCSHKIVYDSSTETLEPIYFYVIDLMEEFGMKTEKLVDNFVSSPGSSHFGEIGQRATIMQQQGAKVLADINTVLRSVLNIIYDLKEFRIRLQSYEDLKSSDKKISAILSLKQIWMDKVDIQKGNSSIKAMAFSQGGPFVTLIDAFLAAKNPKDAEGMDLNDRVKRILIQRMSEFESWLKHSEEELRKRYELEKNYLRSQVNSLQLYSRWAKPYLVAAHNLESSAGGERNSALVKTFNTILLELTVMGKQKIDVEKESSSGGLPADFKKMKFKRDYYSVIFVDFKFRGIPQKVGQQGFAFGGLAEVTFTSYGLNQEELNKFNKELTKSDISDVLKLIEGATSDSLDRLKDEINFFLEEKSSEQEKKEKKDTSNPFLALIGFYNKEEKKSEEKKPEKKQGPIKPDNWVEQEYIRKLAVKKGKTMAFDLFDIYKKAHKMESYT